MGVVCLAAAASAEADAQYGHFGYAGLGHSVYAAPYRYSGVYGYAAPLTGAGITVRGYGTPATVGTHAPYGYAASGHYVADSIGAVHVAKREAEAEAEPEADALYGNYVYGLGYSAYSRPVYGGYSTYSRPIVSSYASPLVSSAAYTRPVYGGYSSYYGKRDAEAKPEADADALYGTYGYGLGYSAYSRPIVSSYAARPVVSSIGYSAYSRPVYGGYSSYYGKREAEAEPEAEAQYLGYSGLYGGYSTYARPVVSSVYSRPIISSVYSRGIYGHY